MGGHHSIHFSHQSGIGDVFGVLLFGGRWMVITPSTSTINLVLALFLVFCCLGSLDGHHSIHFDHQSDTGIVVVVPFVLVVLAFLDIDIGIFFGGFRCLFGAGAVELSFLGTHWAAWQPMPIFFFKVRSMGNLVPKRQEDTSIGMAAQAHFLLQDRLDGQVSPGEDSTDGVGCHAIIFSSESV